MLLGNRDVNKIRLAAELNAVECERTPPHLVQHPCWFVPYAATGDAAQVVPPTAQPTYVDWLAKRVQERHSTMKKEDTRAARAQWILSCTMGAPQSFEHRRNAVCPAVFPSLPPFFPAQLAAPVPCDPYSRRVLHRSGVFVLSLTPGSLSRAVPPLPALLICSSQPGKAWRLPRSRTITSRKI